jgi:hypothetical protein
MKSYKYVYVFGKNNFIIGAGSVFNLFGNFFDYNISETEQEADTRAIANDWKLIGQDLLEVISREPK